MLHTSSYLVNCTCKLCVKTFEIFRYKPNIVCESLKMYKFKLLLGVGAVASSPADLLACLSDGANCNTVKM